jgi:large subunit ribosomal protein L4
MKLPVVDLAGKPVEQLTLDEALWAGKANLRLLAQAIPMYRSNQRAGTASTKTRAGVSGGGKKPWRQKHTGRARAGSIRSPLWRHGGVVFGPHPHDQGFELPKAIRRKALLESLKGKLHDQELVVVDRLHAAEPKTKPFSGLANTFGIERTSLIVLEAFEDRLVKSLRNLARFELRRADDLNAFDVLNAQKVLATKAAFQRVEQRLRNHRPDKAPDEAT